MKSNIVRTQWFDASIRPERIGRYEAVFFNAGNEIARHLAKWNGVEWVYRNGLKPSPACGDKWRGLVNPSASGGRGR